MRNLNTVAIEEDLIAELGLADVLAQEAEIAPTKRSHMPVAVAAVDHFIASLTEARDEARFGHIA